MFSAFSIYAFSSNFSIIDLLQFLFCSLLLRVTLQDRSARHWIFGPRAFPRRLACRGMKLGEAVEGTAAGKQRVSRVPDVEI